MVEERLLLIHAKFYLNKGENSAGRQITTYKTITLVKCIYSEVISVGNMKYRS